MHQPQSAHVVNGNTPHVIRELTALLPPNEGPQARNPCTQIIAPSKIQITTRAAGTQVMQSALHITDMLPTQKTNKA